MAFPTRNKQAKLSAKPKPSVLAPGEVSQQSTSPSVKDKVVFTNVGYFQTKAVLPEIHGEPARTSTAPGNAGSSLALSLGQRVAPAAVLRLCHEDLRDPFQALELLFAHPVAFAVLGAPRADPGH